MKKKGSGRAKFNKKEDSFDSDDERNYKDLPVPDSHSSVYDEIDEFNKNRLKKMKKRFKEQERASSDDELEVLSLNSDDEDDYEAQLVKIKKQSYLEEVASDMDEEEDAEDEDTLPNDKAWGMRKKSFYHTDYVDDDLPGLSDEEEEQAEEGKEAFVIQQRMAQALDEEDFAMDLFKVDDMFDDVETQIVKDLSKLSKKEKLQHLEKDSPELFPLIEEFKSKIGELIAILYPLFLKVKSGHIPNGQPASYVTTKFHLYLNYCINISFYFTLKSKQVSIRDHPILERILAYKNLIHKLKPMDEKLSGDIGRLLKDHKGNGNYPGIHMEIANQINDEHDGTETSHRQGKRTINHVPDIHKNKVKKQSLTGEEVTALEYYRMVEEKVLEKKQEKEKLIRELEPVIEYEDEEDEGKKRAITYQMSKNKGLTVKKKKEQRNPRVKHRMKFRRAKIRRKGQVREPTTEKQRYSGEASGIRAGVIKSVKIQ